MKIDNGVAICDRVVAAGREHYEVALPAIVTVRDGLNIPRYPSVPGRMQARKKPVDMKKAEPRVPKLEKVTLALAPSKAKGAEVLGKGVEGIPALVEVLKKIGTF
jgi:electron transfer flavoprotein beta subunit